MVNRDVVFPNAGIFVSLLENYNMLSTTKFFKLVRRIMRDFGFKITLKPIPFWMNPRLKIISGGNHSDIYKAQQEVLLSEVS